MLPSSGNPDLQKHVAVRDFARGQLEADEHFQHRQRRMLRQVDHRCTATVPPAAAANAPGAAQVRVVADSPDDHASYPVILERPAVRVLPGLAEHGFQ